MTTALQEAPQFSLLDIPGCTFTPTGLTIQPGMKFEQWERIGRALEIAEKGVQWWIGDWLAYGEREYKETYAQAIEATGKSKQTLMNYCFVAKAIDTSRRREVVDFSTHAEVASLKPKQQIKVLDKAEKENLTKNDVRREAHRIKREEGKEKSEIETLHTKEVQSFLQEYIDKLQEFEERVPLMARFLRSMFQNHTAHAHWQKKRSLNADCEIIQIAVKSSGGELSEDDLYKWLIEHGYFMSDPEFEERLEYMNRDDVRLALVTDAGKDGKQDDRRGKLPAIVCVPWRKVWDQGSKRERDEDDE